MTDHPVAIRVLTGTEAHERVAELADILMDCVEGGASVSFMAPLSRDKAQGANQSCGIKRRRSMTLLAG